MKRRWILATVFALSFAFVAAPNSSADDKKPEVKKDDKKEGDKKPEMKKDDKKEVEKKEGDKKPEAKKEDAKPEARTPDKLPDFSAYASAGEYAGELIKSDENGITLRNQIRVKNGNRYDTKNEDVELKYADGALVRRDKAPKMFNDKGLERPATQGELEKLKKPTGAPGFAMDRGDLKNGDLVKAILVRPRTISAAKMKPEDRLIKFAIVVGEAAKPSAPPKK